MEVLGSKLSDKIIKEGFDVFTGGKPLNEALYREAYRLRCVVGESPVFYIQNVVDYYREYMTDDFRFEVEDLPSVAPPFESFFMEFRFPKGTLPRDQYRIHRAGVIFEAFERKEDIATVLAPEIASQSKWLLIGTTVTDYESYRPTLISKHAFPLAGGGATVQGAPHPSALASELFGLDPGVAPEKYKNCLATQYIDILFPALLAVAFTHCKGTTIREEEPPMKLSKAIQSRTGQPLLKYRVIDVNPLRDILLREGRIDEVGLPKALHIVRGHFADYRDRGLFGRNRGVFWKPSHERGNIEAGIVMKDYNSLTS